MTFYYDRLKSRIAPQLPYEKQGNNLFISNWQQQVSVTLLITNMTKEDDCNKLVEMLGTLPGIAKVTPILVQRRLIITYNPSQINLETIGYHIRKLGYHYIQKI
ncbi:hypothetical protein V3F56_13185 [Moorellaceae bacterium AZ2]